jgi:hypothetical protein
MDPIGDDDILGANGRNGLQTTGLSLIKQPLQQGLGYLALALERYDFTAFHITVLLPFHQIPFAQKKVCRLTIDELWMSLSHRGVGFMPYGPEAEA